MKIKIYLVALFLTFACAAQAQFNLGSLEKEAQSALGTGSFSTMLTTLESSLKPEVLTDKFKAEKDKWVKSAQNVKDAQGAAALLAQLSDGLKNSSFKKGWDIIKPKFLAQSKTTTTTSGLASLGTTLNSNLLSSSFTSAGAQSNVTSLLNNLK